MKKEYKLNLHSNKIVNVLKYIVLIFVFIMVGMVNKNNLVKADSDCKQAVHTRNPKDCSESTINYDTTRIRFLVQGLNMRYEAKVYVKFCDANQSEKNCSKEYVLVSKTEYDLIDVDVELYRKNSSRNGSSRDAKGMYWEYKYDACWTCSEDWSGWKKAITYDGSDSTGKRVYLYVDAHYNGLTTLAKAYIDVPAYYFSEPSLSVTEKVGGVDVLNSYRKEHTPTITVNNADASNVTIKYRWLDASINPTTDPLAYADYVTEESAKNSVVVVSPKDPIKKMKLYLKAYVTIGSQYLTLTKNPLTFNFDYTEPTISFYYNGYVSSTWYQKVKVSITYNDTGGSGVNASTQQYCISTAKDSCTGGTWQTYSSDVDVTLSNSYGTRYVHAKVSDNAGNETVVYKDRELKIDTKKPTTSGLSGNSTWLKDASVTLTYSDEKGSQVEGIAYCWYKKDKTCSISGYKPVTNGSLSIKYPSGDSAEEYYLRFRAMDKAGNESNIEKSGAYKVDNSKPEFDSAAEDSKLYGKTATQHSVTVTFTDTGSGIIELYYCWVTSPGSNCSYTETTYSSNSNTITLTGVNGSYFLKVKVVDGVANESALSVLGPYAFDNSTPSFGLVKFSSDSSKASEVEISKVMSVEVEENVIEEEAFENIVVEEPLELVEVVPLANDVSVNELKQEYKEIVIKEEPKMLHTSSGINYGVAIGGIYLFGRKRKRINVC